ncbi:MULTISPECIES: hypothetical protein [Acidiplasma]|uniref:Multipass membrane protein n=4 Tax=Acidiplasma TaxID=507753 RepID=A0A0Q0WEH6_9ARCH|nr:MULTISPECIES: hypothetical protein [Acidiplasma]KQB33776.1 hypothetical protein AOG55_01970 [Acidiplasma cupricumulans]KQB35662.1 hypothetical protein AOG54_02865 [Acidiplasma aeolicum]WMT55182.1 MAG: hypothetical protein RE470_00695 [Acidiplasma sp.]
MINSNAERVALDQKFTLKNSFLRGFPMLVIPPVLLVIILYLHNFYYLEYFHVVAGSMWTGMDLVMGIFFSYVMKGLNNIERARLSTRITPTMLFFMPAISSVTITAGIELVIFLKFSFSSLYIIIALIIAFILLIQGIGIFLPNELRVYSEILHGGKNVEKIVRLTMFNLRLSLSQVILQIAIIFIMAGLATGVFN